MSQNEAPDVAAWTNAMQAAMQAQRDFRAGNGNPEWDSDWDDEVEAILDAAWPHIALIERANGALDERRAHGWTE